MQFIAAVVWKSDRLRVQKESRQAILFRLVVGIEVAVALIARQRKSGELCVYTNLVGAARKWRALQ